MKYCDNLKSGWGYSLALSLPSTYEFLIMAIKNYKKADTKFVCSCLYFFNLVIRFVQGCLQKKNLLTACLIIFKFQYVTFLLTWSFFKCFKVNKFRRFLYLTVFLKHYFSCFCLGRKIDIRQLWYLVNVKFIDRFFLFWFEIGLCSEIWIIIK